MYRCLSQPHIRRVICLLLALAAVWSFADLLRTGQDDVLINHSVVSILLWWACYELMDRAARCLNRRLLCISLCLGLGFSLMMVLGTNVVQYETANLIALRTWRSVLCAWPLFAASSALLIHSLPRMALLRCPALEKQLARMSDRHFFLLCWALVFVSWIPGLIASYPGVYAYDCAYQLNLYTNGIVLNNNPIAHTYWLAACVIELGGMLGSYEAGMCIYSVSQMLLLSASFASLLGFLRRRGAGAVMQLSCLVAFMFVPSIVIFSFSGTKDVAFSAMTLWTLIRLFEIAEDLQLLHKKSFCIKLGLSAFGMAIFRGQGIYLLVFAMLTALFLMAKQRRRVVAVLLTVIVLFGIYQGPLSTLLGVQRSHAPQETLGVPIMQLARVRSYYADELSPEEKAAIESYIPNWKHYSPISCAIADPVKTDFNITLYDENPLGFFKLWLSTAARYPAAYVDAFLRMSIGYWYPDMSYRDWPAYQPYYQYDYHQPEGMLQLQRKTPAALQWLDDWYRSLSLENVDQTIPVFSLIPSAGVAAWILLLFVAWAIYERKWHMLWPASMLVFLWITLLFGPVVLMRYALPLIMAEPVLIGVMRTQKT